MSNEKNYEDKTVYVLTSILKDRSRRCHAVCHTKERCYEIAKEINRYCEEMMAIEILSTVIDSGTWHKVNKGKFQWELDTSENWF